MEQIPWIEKYRPKHFDSIILNENNRIILLNMLKEKLIPHLLFYGPPGTGKTTTIINLINEYQKENNEQHKELVIHLNASDDRGIDVIRNQIHSFSNSSYLFNKGTKFIILDEIDYMTKNAQFSLYNLMNESFDNVRFCLICNYISKLDKSLQNMCMPFKFNMLPRDNIYSFITNIVKEENIRIISNEDINNIISQFNSDIRSMINYLQGITQTQSKSKVHILSEKKIAELIESFLTKKIQVCERKMNDYMYKYNIEKRELIIRIFNYITKHYKINRSFIYFIKCVLHHNNYYLDEFNNFFISNLVSELKL